MGSTTARISVRTFNDYPLDDDNEQFGIQIQSRTQNSSYNTADFKWADGSYAIRHPGVELTATIRNDGALPSAWMVRFGRTVGSQVVDALTKRLDGGGALRVTVAGINITDGTGIEPEIEDDDPFGLPEWAKNAEREADAQSISADDILLRSAFHLSSAGNGTRGAAAFTVWGRVATGGFEAVEDGVTMDGDVTTGLIGFDAEWERALAGVMLSQSKGEGSYGLDRAAGNGAGTVESSLTGVYPRQASDAGEADNEVRLKAALRF